MRYVYSALLYLLLPFLLLRLLWRSRRAPAYRRRIAERFGWFTLPGQHRGRAIWVHAVSLGETLAAAPLLESLLQAYPDHRLVVTTTTPTGSAQLRTLFGERVQHVYAPWDLPGSVGRFLDRVQPRLLIIMETELWPNMLHLSRARGCATLLANGRLSARSARGYSRVPGLTLQMLRQLDCVACQSREDGERFLSLGLPPGALQVTGNIKFDLELSPDLMRQSQQLRQEYRAENRPIWVAASTHPAEEPLVLAAFAAIRETVDDCLLILVPRHPERFDEVYGLCTAAGWDTRRRSSGSLPDAGVDVVLGDTVGELLLLLSLARVAFMGGSLVPQGGHNVLEAAVWGVPVLSGPHMFNFGEISRLLVAAGAMEIVQPPQSLGERCTRLLRDPEGCRRMGAAGQQVVADNRGARERLLQLVAAAF